MNIVLDLLIIFFLICEYKKGNFSLKNIKTNNNDEIIKLNNNHYINNCENRK